MDQGLAIVLPAFIAALGVIISAIIARGATIKAAQIASRQTPHDSVRPKEPYEKEDHRVQDQVAERRNEPSKLTMLLRVSPGFVAPVIFGLAVVAVFVYVPFVSDYAFWFVVVAYIIMAGYRPPSK